MKKSRTARFSFKIGESQTMRTIQSLYFWSFLSYIVFLAWSSVLLVSINPSWDNYTLRLILNTSTIQPILSSMAEILATVLAISFSIAIVVIQHAASSYTASILEIYKRDFLTVVFFLYYVCSLVLTIIAMQFTTNLYLANMTLVTFLFSFPILFLQFLHIIDLIDPRNIIEKAEKKCANYISSIPSKIKSILKSKKPVNKFEKYLLETPIYRQFIFQQETILQEPIRKQVLLINDVINKAISRREIETSIRGFQALSKIVKNYVAIRQEDFVSDDKFLEYIYNQLLSVFTIGLDNKDASLMQEILHALEDIGCSTTSLKAVNGPNHMTNLAMAHIRDFGLMALEKSFADVATMAIASLKTVSLLTIQKTNSEGLASDYIFEIGEKGVQRNDWYVLGVALNQLKELLLGAVSFKVAIHAAPTQILEHIGKLSILGTQNGIDHWALQTSLFTMMPEYSIQAIAWAALQLKNEEYAQIETHSREEYSKGIIAKLIQTISSIATVSSRAHSSHTLGSSVDCLLDITLLMIKEKFKTIPEGFKTEILLVVEALKASYLPIAVYSSDKEWHLSIPAEIGDALTSIAVFAMESQKEVTIECLDTLHQVCLIMVKHDKWGYDVARLAARIGVIGAIATNRNESVVAEKAATLLADFDKNYLQYSPNPQKGEHIDEIKSLHKRFEKDFTMYEKTEAYSELYKNIKSTDIKSFIEVYEQKRMDSE